MKGHSVQRNAAWAFLGAAVPLPLALITVPVLTRTIGADRFGVLALILAVIGSSSFLDLGLGRAITRLVAEETLEGAEGVNVRLVVKLLIGTLGILGGVGAIAVSASSYALVERFMRVPVALQSEAGSALRLMSIALPFVTMTAGLKGIQEGMQAFRRVGLVNSIIGSALLIAPVVALAFSHSLVAVVAAVVVVRIAAWLTYLVLAFSSEIPEKGRGSADLTGLVSLFRFGGWITVSNIIGPVLTYFDRFVVGSVMSVAAVAYYAAPYDLVMRLGIVPGAVNGALFPALAQSSSRDEAAAAWQAKWGIRSVTMLLVPPVILLVTLAPEGLRLWLGPEFSEHSSSVLRWLAVGVLVNAVAQTPFTVLQSAGRADLTARLHLLEVGPYLVTIWWLVTHFGVTGAAVAWVVRASVDAILMFALACQILPDLRPAMLACIGAIPMMIGLVAIQPLLPLNLRIVLMILGTCVALAVMWRSDLGSHTRRAILSASGLD